jgi:hypothetical protein
LIMTEALEEYLSKQEAIEEEKEQEGKKQAR